MVKRLVILFCFLGTFLAGHAQEFGGIPPSIQWRQINTDSIRVIFPKGFEQLARQVANTTTYINQHKRASIGSKELKLNIILQNYTTTSNGFVALSPFRSVFQTTPPADNFSLGSINWLNELSMHEYWHALQNMNFRVGIGKTFHDIFGDNGQAFITNLLIPNWFWEGDAVFMETALSDQGRGRLPSFLEPFKSLSYAGINYSYAKIRNGSLRDMVPDQYPLGYMMSAYGRNTYGISFWKNTMRETLLDGKAIKKMNAETPDHPYHLFKYGFYPLSSVLHYRTGTKIKGFYKKSLDYFAKQWDVQRDTVAMTPVATIKENHSRSNLNYRYPHVLPDGSLIAIKYGNAVLPQIVRIDSLRQDSTLVKMGNLDDIYFSYAKNKIVWAEYRPDPRWGWVDYSVVRLYDMRSGRATTLSHKTRYFSPALSPDGEKICVVNVAPGLHYQLLLLDTKTGRILKTFPNPRRYEYTYPVFSLNGKYIVTALRDSTGKMALAKINLTSNEMSALTPFILKPLGPPSITSSYIFFPAAFNNNVQLYAWSNKSEKLFRVAKRPLGNYSLAVDTTKQRIIFDEYSAKGYTINEIPDDPNSWEEISWPQAGRIHTPYVPEAINQIGGNILDSISDRTYQSSSYNGLKRLFKIHSWSFMPNFPEIGLYLQSQNMLQTLQLNAGGGYDLNEKTPFVSAYGVFGGWFPFITAGFKEIFNRSGYIENNTTISWNESNAYLGFYVPLDLSGSLYNRLLNVGSSFNINGLHYKNNPNIKIVTENITYADSYLSFSNTHTMSTLDFYPKLGQTLSLRYRTTLNNLFAWQWTGGLNLFFPGLSPHHSFYIVTSFAVKDQQKEYKFSDDFSYAVGYNAVPYYKIYKASFNYQFPLAYPDWGLTWAYLLRVRANLSFDYSHANMLPPTVPAEGTYRSAGLAVFLDTKLFSSLSVPIGIRYGYLLDKDYDDPKKHHAFQITFPVTF